MGKVLDRSMTWYGVSAILVCISSVYIILAEAFHYIAGMQVNAVVWGVALMQFSLFGISSVSRRQMFAKQ